MNQENPQQDQDEPYAWESREFLRKKLIGKEVVFTVEYKPPGSTREYGFIYAGKDTTGENMTETMVSEGLVEVRRGGLKQTEEGQHSLISLEETARAGGKGKWAPQQEHAAHVRQVTWTLENPRQFVTANPKPVDAVIEHVRDGCTVRAFVLPSFQYITVMLTGVKCPMFKMEGDKNVPELYAEEAKYYVESRLLQQDVKIQLEGTSGQNNLLGTVVHAKGNITELLLKDGFARCVDWSIGQYTEGPAKLRECEKEAKAKKVRLWKDYQPATSTDTKDAYSAKVVEISNGDCLMVKGADDVQKKIFLASIRPPRLSDTAGTADLPKREAGVRPRPLYDVPYMFEAREFLRKKLVGKKINVQVDYIQPKNDDFQEKICCTVTIGNINVAEALVSKGLATVVRYRQDDDRRSSCYDDLLQAENRAQTKAQGLHNKKHIPTMRVADVSGDSAKAKQFFPFLQRAKKTEALVEFVASGSRLRCYMPKETCLITLLLAGIDCPRGARPAPGGGGGMLPAQPCGEDALKYTRDLILQREILVEVESMDKGGNFIGWVHVDDINLSEGLLEQGFSKLHFSAERSSYYNSLQAAQERAKTKKLGVWANYEEPKETVAPEKEPQERKLNYKSVVVTEITPDLHFFAQSVDSGTQLEALMSQMRAELTNNPPLSGAYTPKKGELCAARFTQDEEWYRAKVEKVGKTAISLLYIDYGNREDVDATHLAVLPTQFRTFAAQAHEYGLAMIALPKDEDDLQMASDALFNDIMNKQLSLNVEYKVGSLEFVSLQYQDSKEDVAKTLVSEGMLLVETRREKRLATMAAAYKAAQDDAKKARKNLWQYGDFTDDDTREFGYNP